MIRSLNAVPAIFLLALLPGAGLLAQERITPFLGGGLALGTGDLADDTGAGWMIFGGVDVPVGAEGFSLGLAATFSEVPHRGGFDEKNQVTTVTADVGWSFLNLVGSGVTPCLRLGAGIRVDRFEPGELAGPGTSDSGLGGNLAGGVAIPLGRGTALVGTHLITGRNAGVWGVHAGFGVPLERPFVVG